ncbi:hypothetical protein P378_06290 [Desulforamulus profundi]|uniref:Translation initiation factor IF-2 N-terminal domain-containing protein n=1 Tax=Desulforamulus profundi TaxID=1383067 RepID=A0A2C6MGR7_9FIRM|nr:translation initiation factor IF-2 N-terminal domain-containing protein [Desulforamulus profundi]PHJ38915.1 hypothetical protein P378_06290 [Desulforamulus profundi]
MAKKRVHELAKELNIENKDLINKLVEMGISVKSHMSALEDNDIQKVVMEYGKKKNPVRENKTEPMTKQNPNERGRGQGMEGKKERDQLFRPDNAKVRDW